MEGLRLAGLKISGFRWSPDRADVKLFWRRKSLRTRTVKRRLGLPKSFDADWFPAMSQIHAKGGRPKHVAIFEKGAKAQQNFLSAMVAVLRAPAPAGMTAKRALRQSGK